MSKEIPIEENPIVTVNANGYGGAVFVRRERCVMHDDVMVIEVLEDKIDLNFLKYQLQNAIEQGDFEYEAKLYSRVKELCIEIPVTQEGEFDVSLAISYIIEYSKRKIWIYTLDNKTLITF